MKKCLTFFLLMLALLQANKTLAWNAAGHHLMSAITWDLLSIQQQDYWVDILEHHPRFQKDFKERLPKYINRNRHLYNEWIFRRASTWPDVARNIHASQRDKYHHGKWHYVNYPLYLDRKVNTKFLNRNSKWKGKFHNNLNITQAIKGNIEVLSQPSTSKKQKALALSWVLHLAGDAHQPLHSTALFSKKYFKKGDKGGNAIKISGQGRVSNLHWYWDSRLDTTTSFRIIELKAKKLSKKHREFALDNLSNSIKQWSKNANIIAKQYAYTPMLLDKLKQYEKDKKPQPKINISNAYDIEARKIAEKQVVKAGFQLAYILKEL